jgi:putative endonuclease
MRAWGARDLSSILSTPTMKGWLYILTNDQDKFYVGSTNDLGRRLKEHNFGNNKSTKFGIPWKIVFSQEYDSIDTAREAENRIKSFKSKVILKKIISDGVFLKVT